MKSYSIGDRVRLTHISQRSRQGMSEIDIEIWEKKVGKVGVVINIRESWTYPILIEIEGARLSWLKSELKKVREMKNGWVI